MAKKEKVMDLQRKPGFFGPSTQQTVEASERWVRVKLGGETIADSKEPLLLIGYGPDLLPTYFFGKECVRMDLLSAPFEKEGKRFWTVCAGDKLAHGAAWEYIDPPAAMAALKDQFTFEWSKMDAWYEEEEEVFVHARDPHKRVDVMPSSRHVKVVIAGTTIAETSRPRLLFETSLPTRFYIPQEDLHMEFLQPSEKRTRCPYKGEAIYWSVKIGEQIVEDVVWSYPSPIPENPKIKGLLCFFNEKVDLYVDGELQARPYTPWS